jgi:hypothetical protein
MVLSIKINVFSYLFLSCWNKSLESIKSVNYSSAPNVPNTSWMFGEVLITVYFC